MEHVLYGEPDLYERLGGLLFRLTAGSFFQVNTRMADRLYALVAEAASPEPSDVVLDLFCGAGTIGLTLASRCKSLYGYELSEEAVGNARANAALNRVANATFVQGDLSLAKLRLEASGMPSPDVVVTDPNRPGMSPKLVAWLNDCGARRIAYVSCNPATMARDMRALCNAEGGGKYALRWVRPVDMFPQTGHVEVVGLLELQLL